MGDRKVGHDQSYSDNGGYECYADCRACAEEAALAAAENEGMAQ